MELFGVLVDITVSQRPVRPPLSVQILFIPILVAIDTPFVVVDSRTLDVSTLVV